jgi:hypothetical protein
MFMTWFSTLLLTYFYCILLCMRLPHSIRKVFLVFSTMNEYWQDLSQTIFIDSFKIFRYFPFILVLQRKFLVSETSTFACGLKEFLFILIEFTFLKEIALIFYEVKVSCWGKWWEVRWRRFQVHFNFSRHFLDENEKQIKRHLNSQFKKGLQR